MIDTIKPALTPQQWADLNGSCYFVGSSEFVYEDGELEDGISISAATVHVDLPKDDRHGIAALCLHGQPFGFTREDVRRLREYPDLYGGLQRTCVEAEWQQFVDSLADRTEALLPPE